MSGKATGMVWEMHLPRPLKYVLLALADHADHDGGSIRPGVELLAWKCELEVRHVQRLLRELEGLGVIVPEEGTKGGAGNITCYRIDFDAVAKLPPKPRKRVTFPHKKTSQKGDIPAHQKGDIPAQLSLEKGDIQTQERVTSTHKKGDISSRARTSIELNGKEPSERTVIISEDATFLFRRFCEITNAELSEMPDATVRTQGTILDGLLADYGRADIEGCMRWLQTWRTVPWTMTTVRKEIAEWIAKGRPASGKTEPKPPAMQAPRPSSGVVSRADGSAQRRLIGRG